MTLTQLVQQAYDIAHEKGWHDKPRSFGDLIALCHSELSEALEEHRSGHVYDKVYKGPNGKPEGIPAELADVVIRIADICGQYGIDLEEAVRSKLEYNKRREYRHGGKTI